MRNVSKRRGDSNGLLNWFDNQVNSFFRKAAHGYRMQIDIGTFVTIVMAGSTLRSIRL